MSLRITQAKPNPAGKDRARSYPLPQQLNGEWVDIKNTGTQPHAMDDIELNHLEFQPRCMNPQWRGYMTFKGSLGPGQVLRVHAGHKPTALPTIDAAGADIHLYTDSDQFVLNNDCGDSIGLWQRSARVWEDSVSYDPYPPEGSILHRQGDKLV